MPRWMQRQSGQEMWAERFEKQWLEALGKVAGNGGLFVTVCHGQITGAADDRLAAFDSVVARAQKDGFDIVTVGEVAAQVLASEGRA